MAPGAERLCRLSGMTVVLSESLEALGKQRCSCSRPYSAAVLSSSAGEALTAQNLNSGILP